MTMSEALRRVREWEDRGCPLDEGERPPYAWMWCATCVNDEGEHLRYLGLANDEGTAIILATPGFSAWEMTECDKCGSTLELGRPPS